MPVQYDDKDINWDVIEDCRRKATDYKKPFEADKAENRAALLGYQWVTYDYETQSLEQVSPDDQYADETGGEAIENPRVTDNLLRETEQQRIAECTSLQPRFHLEPTSPSQKHKIATENAHKLAKVKWNELKMSRIVRTARLLADTDGISYLWPYWDKTAGKMLKPEPGSEMSPKPMGDVGMQVVTDDHVFVDPSAVSLDEARYVFVEYGMGATEVKELYGLPDKEMGEMIIEPTAPYSSQEKLWRDLMGDFDTIEGVQWVDNKNKAKSGGFITVVHYMEKPSSRYPAGLYLIYTEYSASYQQVTGIGVSKNKRKFKILYRGTLELDGKRGFNLIELTGGVRMPGRFYPNPDMTSARKMQYRLNNIETKIDRILDSSMPIVEASIEAFPADLSSEENLAGYVQVVKGIKMILTSNALTGGMPAVKPIANINVPSQMYAEKAFCIQRINQIMGVDQISTEGLARPQAYTIQRANTRLQGNIVEPQEESLAQTMMWVIWLCKRYYGSGREVEYMGDMRIPLALFISSDDIDFKSISVEPGSMMLSNQQARIEKALLAWNQGLIPPTPANQRQLRRYINEMDVFPEDTDYLNERNAQEENIAFLLMVTAKTKANPDNEDISGVLQTLRGISPESENPLEQAHEQLKNHDMFPDVWILPDNDDHDIHIPSHKIFPLTPDVRNLPLKERERVTDICNIHARLHELAKMQGLGYSERAQALREALLQQQMTGQAGAAAQGKQPGMMPGVGGTTVDALGQPKPHQRDVLSGTPGEFHPEEQNPITDFPSPGA